MRTSTYNHRTRNEAVNDAETNSLAALIIALIAMLAIGYGVYSWYNADQTTPMNMTTTTANAPAADSRPVSNYE